jgi:hypothetical protein
MADAVDSFADGSKPVSAKAAASRSHDASQEGDPGVQARPTAVPPIDPHSGCRDEDMAPSNVSITAIPVFMPRTSPWKKQISKAQGIAPQM